MSPKLFNPLENPPNSSSSDEEYEEEAEEIIGNSSSEEEEEEETDSEPETERKEPVKNPVPSVVKKNQDSKKVDSSATKKRASEADAKRVKTVSEEASSEEEEEEETDSEPETEIKEPVKNNGPSVKKKNQDSKKVDSSATKKPASEADAKRVKTVSEEASSEEEEEETDSEPETETKEPVKNPVPSVVKKNQDSKKVESPATKKRASEADASSKDAKRVKTASGEETKKNYFQRVWSEEDEIAVLQGIIDYNIETGASPYDDTNVFYELVKKSISFDVSKIQFMEKIRGLRKKFENNLAKGKKKKNGEDPAFSKPHDRKAFDLSKLVWGDNGIMALDSSAVKSKSKKVEPKKQEELFSSSSPKLESMKEQGFVSIVESVARFGVDGLAAQQGWNRLASEEKKRFEEQWKALQIKEFKFFAQKSGFIHQVVTKMAEAFPPNP